MKARIIRIESGCSFRDGERRITLQFEAADPLSMNIYLRFREGALPVSVLRSAVLDAEFQVTFMLTDLASEIVNRAEDSYITFG